MSMPNCQSCPVKNECVELELEKKFEGCPLLVTLGWAYAQMPIKGEVKLGQPMKGKKTVGI